jgi:hypothetical protein
MCTGMVPVYSRRVRRRRVGFVKRDGSYIETGLESQLHYMLHWLGDSSSTYAPSIPPDDVDMKYDGFDVRQSNLGR